MKVSFFASEAVPFAKTGGLADVAGTLPIHLADRGASVRVFLPLYGFIDRKKFGLKKIADFRINVKDIFTNYSIYRASRAGVEFYFVMLERFFSRRGIYGDEHGDYKDNALRFIFFQKASLDFLRREKLRTDIFHVNDWQTALIPRFREEFGLPGKTLLTIHNLAYQGIFDVKFVYYASMTDRDLYFGKVNFLFDGIVNADFVTTVSPSYAREITRKKFGCGLEKFLNRKKVEGILNGLDYTLWNPETDKSIPQNYSSVSVSGKIKCREFLMKKLFLEDDGKPLFGFVGRAADQKGFDIISPVLRGLLNKKIPFVFLCDGDKRYRRMLMTLKKDFPKKISVNFKFDENLAHQIYAASDFFMMPSQFEPCGLGQMIAMRYGAIPVVSSVGGLKDTVSEIDPISGRGTGFLLKKYSPGSFNAAVLRAVSLFEDERKMDFVRKRIMRKRFFWSSSARRYIKIYRKLLRGIDA